MPFWPNDFAAHSDPRQVASARACEGMIPPSVKPSAAAVAFLTASSWAQRQAQTQPAAQSDLHHFGWERGGRVRRHRCKPGSRLLAGLGKQQGTVGWFQGRQQHAFAEVVGASTRRMKLPTMWPCSHRAQLPLQSRAQARCQWGSRVANWPQSVPHTYGRAPNATACQRVRAGPGQFGAARAGPRMPVHPVRVGAPFADVVRVIEGHAQHGEPALAGRSVAAPDFVPDLVHSRRRRPVARIVHARLADIGRDSAMLLDARSYEVKALPGPPRGGDDIQVIQVCKQLLTRLQFSRCPLEAIMLAQRKKCGGQGRKVTA